MTHILVVGLPRSGTTWIASVLGGTSEATVVMEPDNHLVSPYALRAKLALPGGYHPALKPDAEAADYLTLWRAAFGDEPHGRPALEVVRQRIASRLLAGTREADIRVAFRTSSPPTAALRLARMLAVPQRPRRRARHIVVKSVYAARAVEWIAKRIDVRVVIVHRNLLNVVSSWLELGWIHPANDDELTVSDPRPEPRETGYGPSPPIRSSPEACLAWFLGTLTLDLKAAARRNPSWSIVHHEDLCGDLSGGFRALSGQLGLHWTSDAEARLLEANRPGSGYELNRLAAEAGDAWRARFSREQASAITEVLETLGRADESASAGLGDAGA